jgi:hypothetical protein
MGQKYSTGGAGRVLGLSPERVRQLANAGKVACEKTPIGRLFDAGDLAALMRERAEQSAATRKPDAG